MKNSSMRRLVLTGVALIALAATGLVYAAWTANGTGSGYVKASSAQALTTVDGSASTAASLYPGADGNVRVEISNPNPYPVRVTAVSGNGAITADGGHAGCVTTGVTFSDQSNLSVDVAANGSATTTLNGAAHMSNASDNGCQGATFTVPVSLTGASSAP